MNPVIKFTTLFGLLAVEIAVTMKDQGVKNMIGGVLLSCGAGVRLPVVLRDADSAGEVTLTMGQTRRMGRP